MVTSLQIAALSLHDFASGDAGSGEVLRQSPTRSALQPLLSGVRLETRACLRPRENAGEQNFPHR